MSEATTLARVIVRQVLEAGITDAVLSPGSRNAPLSLAFYQAEKRGLIKLHVKIDERGAAFFALGLAKASGRPVPVICTSGTAVANFHPAVLEASHTNAPLLVLTADRPARLRRTGANQTTEQARIFGKAVRYFADISGSAYPMELPFNSLQSGPVHLNIQFDEPLIGETDQSWLDDISITVPKIFDRKTPGTFYTKSTRGLLIVGHDRAGLTQESVEDFAAELGWPVIAEDPLSHKSAIAHASIFLTSTKIRSEINPDTVIVIGRTTLSRSVNALIAGARKTIVIDPRMATVDQDRYADQKFTALPRLEIPTADPEWVATWKKLGERASKVVAELGMWSEEVFARDFAAALPSGSSLFVSSSRPIRDFEGFATPRSDLHIFANRGLAGIDGNISTALGIASSCHSAYAVLGDLSFLHDVSALSTVDNANLRIFVIDNNGGGIFSTLPQAGLEGFEKIFGTPHDRDIAAIVRAFGLATSTISTSSDLIKKIAEPIKGVEVVVIKVPSRQENGDYLKSIYAKMESL
ncbi:MAG: 2-succinyl-5-enolpyruvyl-6-hydroxy-3-cyclohexene-1-carboxylic-acid synthase [Candidatus Planktophila sp.]